MGNRFFINWHDFHGYAVEKHICHWGAVEAGERTASGRRVCAAMVPLLWNQSQNGLQVVEGFHRWRSAGFGGSISSTATGALANATAVDSSDCSRAQAAPPLGTQKNPGLLAAPLWASARHDHHRPVVAAVAVCKPTPASTT